MRKDKPMRWVGGIAAILLMLLAGCQSRYMLKAEVGSEPAPTQGKALIVFLRPSIFGGVVQSSIYDARNADHGGDRFVGIVSTNTKLAYQVDPGKRLFMVIAETADFLAADLEAGKTYYVLVSPRPGILKARFTLLPIRSDAEADRYIHSAKVRGWLADTRWVTKTPESEQWFAENKASVIEKKLNAMDKWRARDPGEVRDSTLMASDGI